MSHCYAQERCIILEDKEHSDFQLLLFVPTVSIDACNIYLFPLNVEHRFVLSISPLTR